MRTKILNFVKTDLSTSKLVDEIASEIQIDYINFLSALGEEYSKDINWWMLNFVSRNTLVSPLFKNICYLVMLKRKLNEGQTFDEIIIDSYALRDVLYDFFLKNNYSLKITYKGKNIIRIIFNRVLSYVKVLIHILLRLIYSRKTHKYKKKIKVNKALILLDIFVLNNSFNKGFYNDRYYPNLLEYVDSNEKEYIYYVPTFYGIKNYGKVFLDIRKSKQNFLIKEDYLKFKDYIFALLYPFRMRKFSFKFGDFMGFDISPLLNEEISNDKVSNSSIYGLLNYNFTKRLRENKVKVKTVVSWFENQTIDHGFNSGFRKYYPEVNLMGYLGIPLQNNNLSIYPTEQERINEVIPKDIFVIGKGYVEPVKQFCKSLSVKVAPAFRLSGVWNKRKYYPDKNKFTILIALPILMDESDEIISMILKAAFLVKVKNIIFKIKPHPAHNMEKVSNKWKMKLTEAFEFIDGDFNSWIEKSDILISCTSSVCLETLAKGIPVIILANKLGLTQLPIPRNIKQDIWKLCYSVDDVIEAIKLYANKDSRMVNIYKKISCEIRDKFFEPVTELGVRRLLNL